MTLASPQTNPTMKIPRLHAALAGLLTLAGATAAQAQFDDVYFDPSDAQEVSSRNYGYSDDVDEAYADNGDYDSEFVGGNQPAQRYDDVARYGESDFDNRPITSDDYTGYEYSSRIRRFNRPYQGFGYYDPVYVDQYYYGARPGFQTALIYNSPYSYNAARFNRFGAFNNPYAFDRFGRRSAFYDPFSPFNDPFYGGASAFGWGSPYGVNAFGGGFNRFGGGGFGGGYYCPPTWGNTGVAYNTPNAVQTRQSSLADRSGRTVGSRGGSARPTVSNRATVPTRRTRPDQSLRTSDPSTTRSSRPASRTNGRVAPSRSNSRSTSPSRSSSRSAPQERTSRPSYSRPAPSTRSTSRSRSATPSRSYSTPRSSSSSSRSYSSPRSSSSSRSSSSPRSSSSSRSSSRSPR